MEKEIRKKLVGDVVVIGGGFAGIGASIAAGRKGLKVYLVEASTTIGGVMSFCLGMPLGGGYPLDNNIGGVFHDFVERLYVMNPPAAEKRECSLHEFGPEVLYDYDTAVHTLFTMLEETNVHVLLNTIAVEPVVNEYKIESLILCDKSGELAVDAKIFLDCSGDGEIAKKTGVPYTIGDDNGNMMGVTLTFLMKNASWNTIFPEEYDPYFRKFTKKGIEEGKIHEDLYKLYLMKGFHKDTVFFNSVVIKGVDATCRDELTRATHEARKRCHDLKNFVKEAIPGFENAVMVNTGVQVGVRETRRFEGMHYLTGEELAKAMKFDDGIVACNNPIDDVMRRDNSITHDSIVEEGKYYTIPFRSLVPEKIENLMFAGRLISADPTAFASLRGMPQCMQMGHAVGLAASMAIGQNIKVQDIDRTLIVEGLRKEGLSMI